MNDAKYIGMDVPKVTISVAGDVSGAAFPLSHADRGIEQGHGGGRGSIEQTRSQTSGRAATVAHLGSWTGDGQAQGVYGSDGCAGLFLRSAESLATRHKRKHEPAAAAILPARHRAVALFLRAARPGLAALEPTPAKDLRIPHSCE
jgi:hypothetical protein